ncbi:MAG: hypothetical protein M1830_003962 [Pleopsidium flavum]|nr:MAG: hypothetical protein M1830_003962 [Pleopsidium flavum]
MPARSPRPNDLWKSWPGEQGEKPWLLCRRTPALSPSGLPTCYDIRQAKQRSQPEHRDECNLTTQAETVSQAATEHDGDPTPGDDVELRQNDYSNSDIHRGVKTQDGSASFSAEQLCRISASNRPGKRSTVLSPGRRLECRSLALWLVSLYTAVILVSWTLTCLLSFRPIEFAPYLDTRGSRTPQQYEMNDRWRKAARTMNSIMTTITISITSSVCAKAAVIYAQQHPGAKRKAKMTMRQLLALADKGWTALADKGWTDLRILSSLLLGGDSQRVRSHFLFFAAGLCGLGLIIPTLQQAFVDRHNIKVVTCSDIWSSNCSFQAQQDKPQGIGGELELSAIALTPLNNVAMKVRENTVIANRLDYQPQLWWKDSLEPVNLLEAYNFEGPPPAGTSFFRLIDSSRHTHCTGILREHSLSLNSSLSCQSIPEDQFPTTCPGAIPFTARYAASTRSKTSEESQYPTSEFKFPARHHGGNKSRFHSPAYSDATIYDGFTMNDFDNYTIHCTANTSRGYFELPNSWNNGTADSLLENWPSYQDITKHFNEPGYENETVDALPVPEVHPYYTPGPLLTSVISIFGNSTFFSSIASAPDSRIALNETCIPSEPPFSNLVSTSNRISTMPDCKASGPAAILINWLNNCADVDYTRQALTCTIFFAHQATLTQAMIFGEGGYVSSSAGSNVQRLSIPLPAMIAISILILIQLAGLLGAALADELPLISAIDAEEVLVLDEKEGWIGASQTDEDDEDAEEMRTLVIGGRGPVRKRRLYRMAEEGT